RLQVAFYRVKDAVDELSRLEGRETTCDLERFVYHNGLGSIRFVEEFVDGQPQDISVDYGHSLDAPMFGTPLYQIIDLVEVGDRAHREVVGKLASDIAHVVAERLPVATGQVFDARPCNVVLKEHL